MEEKWIAELREHFPAAKRVAFFDIAYENCGSDFVREACMRFFDEKADIRPGIVKAGGAGKGGAIRIIAEAREKLAAFLNAGDIRRVAFTENTCQAMNLILHSYPFEPGDNIVVGDMEHVSVLMPCLQMKRFGVEVRVVPSDGLMLTAEQLLEYVDEHTRFVCVSSVQSASGYRIDLRKLCDECHKRGAYVASDVIQELGFRKVDVRELGLDAAVASCYKGVLGIEGLGFAYCTAELTKKLQPLFAGDSPALGLDRDTWEIVRKDDTDIRIFETGTIPFQSIYALHAALSRIEAIGIERMAKRVSECWERIHEALTEMGYYVTTPADPERRCHSQIIKIGEKSAEFTAFALENGVFFSEGRQGHVRAAAAPFNTDEDIDKLIAVFKKWKDERGVS